MMLQSQIKPSHSIQTKQRRALLNISTIEFTRCKSERDEYTLLNESKGYDERCRHFLIYVRFPSAIKDRRAWSEITDHPWRILQSIDSFKCIILSSAIQYSIPVYSSMLVYSKILSKPAQSCQCRCSMPHHHKSYSNTFTYLWVWAPLTSISCECEHPSHPFLVSVSTSPGETFQNMIPLLPLPIPSLSTCSFYGNILFSVLPLRSFFFE